ncbi:MAG: hypothetical protein JO142_00580 [Burkholderiales bacterium]|nr:hypothetical protein [Burkholderiales bacterium]
MKILTILGRVPLVTVHGLGDRLETVAIGVHLEHGAQNAGFIAVDLVVGILPHGVASDVLRQNWYVVVTIDDTTSHEAPLGTS